MWKIAIPALVFSGILLVGCTNNGGAMPENNETPAEDVRDDAREWENNEDSDVEGHDGNGTTNDNRNNNGTNQTEDSIYDAQNSENGNEIIEDLNRKNDVE